MGSDAEGEWVQSKGGATIGAGEDMHPQFFCSNVSVFSV